MYHYQLKQVFSTLIYPVIFVTSLFIVTPAYADTLLSPSFEIDMSNINMTSGSKSSASYKITDTVGQTAQGEFNSSGYTIKAGFQYIYSIIPFSFTISNLNINFGTLIPGTPSLLTNTLRVTTGSAFGYTVKTIEDHSLRQINGSTTIPDTSCDLVSPCTPTDATSWTDNARYGFGYNIQGSDVDTADFVNSNYYRSFPIQNTNDPAIVMSRSGIATNSAATVTYKLNISGQQAAGNYQNGVQYIATPSF